MRSLAIACSVLVLVLGVTVWYAVAAESATPGGACCPGCPGCYSRDTRDARGSGRRHGRRPSDDDSGTDAREDQHQDEGSRYARRHHHEV